MKNINFDEVNVETFELVDITKKAMEQGNMEVASTSCSSGPILSATSCTGCGPIDQPKDPD